MTESRPSARRRALALAASLAAGWCSAAPVVVDNDRPVRLILPTTSGAWDQITFSLQSPAGARVDLRPGPGQHPTRRAKQRGGARPGFHWVQGHLARLARPPGGATHLFWSSASHHGESTWPPGSADEATALQRARSAARILARTLESDDPRAWTKLAERMPQGSTVEIRFRVPRGLVTLYAGEEGPALARAAAQQMLTRRDPARQLERVHSPAWVAPPDRPRFGLLVAGPVVAQTFAADPEADLRALAGFLVRPMTSPASPSPGGDP